MRKTGKIHFAKLENSERLKRLLRVLESGPKTTMQIIEQAHICAVNTAIQELRENGYEIACEAVNKSVYRYRLIGRAA